jgi:NitT/TauT family transport system substrate-binding protein
VSLLEREASGKVLVQEPDAITTLLVARVEFVKRQGDLVGKFVTAHEQLTDWIAKNPAEAQQLVREELMTEMRANVSEELIARAWERIMWTHEVSRQELDKIVTSAQAVGFLRNAPDLSRLIEKR